MAVIGGSAIGALVVGACGLEVGGPAIADSPDGASSDTSMADTFMLPDAPMDIQTPDLGTGETESGMQCTCTPALPGGWTFVAWQEKMRPNCPTGWDMPNNTVSNLVAGPMTCSCTEQQAPMTAPTCTGSTAFTIGFDKSGGCNTITDTINCASPCSAVNKTYNGTGGDFGYFAATGSPAPTGGACANPSGVTAKPVATYDQGRFCKLKGSAGTCNGGACVTTPGGNDSICIWKAGFNVCPMGFPNTHYVGDNVNDTRSCGPDACNGTKVTFNKGMCSKATLGLYSDNQCATALFTPQTADNSCINEGQSGNSLSFQSCGYTSTNSGASCTYTGSFTAQGGAVLSPYQTICCL